MKLYSLAGSRYGSRCAIQISAKGLDIPIELVPMPMSERFTQINPLRLVPVLETDGVFLPESQVICEYLEDLGQGPSLRPEAPLACAKMRLLIRFFELYFDPPLLEIYGFLRAGPTLERAKVVPLFERLKRGLDLIGNHLSGEKYAVGGKLSLADCALMPPFLQTTLLFPRLGLGDPIAAHKTISAYYDQTKTDPHVAPVLENMTPPLEGWFDRIVYR